MGAAIIDTLLLAAITLPASMISYGYGYLQSDRFIEGPADVLVNGVLPAWFPVWLWVRTGQTPGKRVIGAYIVDAENGRPITLQKAIIGNFGYFVSGIVLLIGYVWVGFDARKQEWHDHMAGAVVVRKRHRGPEPIAFRG